MSQINLCGVRIDDLTMERAVQLALAENQGPCWVVTPNALMLESCRKNTAHAALLNRASLSLADGAGVLLAARRAHTPLTRRIAGIDFGEALLREAEKKGLRVFLLGGKDGIAARAGEKLCARYPALKIAGTYWGYFSEQEEKEVLHHVLLTKPDILFVCLGFPKQETWIWENLPFLTDLRVVAGLGGSLDVWAGDVRRAPVLLRRCGMEWAWRMAVEPRRLTQIPSIIRFVGRK